MNDAKLKRLLQMYFDNTISYADFMELLEYLKDADTNKLEDYISEDLLNQNQGPDFDKAMSKDIWKRITSDARYHVNEEPLTSRQHAVIKFYRKTWVQLAAVLLVVFAAGLLIYNRQLARPVIERHYTQQKKDVVILPGSTKAILTTDNGQQLILEQAANGLLVKSGSAKVLKTHSGQLVYNAEQKQAVSAQQVSYNTLTTPRGGEYQVILADGTKVWLNAASSITYPAAFNGPERRVKLSGEAYFEVAKNAGKPFYVNTAGGEIRVLGTHFNISAYADDNAMAATLLEGSVQITKNQSSLMLKPGQQAVIAHGSDQINVTEARLDEVMAWKNGYFVFDEDNIAGIMKKVARWYDVDVQYRDSFDGLKFGGTFHRSKGISELLHYLEKIGNIHFLITERRITVTR